MKIFRKVYPDLALLGYTLLDYFKVVAEYDEYDDNWDVEGSETLSEAIIQVSTSIRNETQP